MNKQNDAEMAAIWVRIKFLMNEMGRIHREQIAASIFDVVISIAIMVSMLYGLIQEYDWATYVALIFAIIHIVRITFLNDPYDEVIKKNRQLINQLTQQLTVDINVNKNIND